MAEESEGTEEDFEAEVVVSASTVEEIATAIGATFDEREAVERRQEDAPAESRREELEPVFDALEDAVEGLRIATEKDSRGKMRKKVMEYSGREDMANWEFGSHLETLQTHGIAEKDGKRWRLAD